MFKAWYVVVFLALSPNVCGATPLTCFPCLFYSGDWEGFNGLTNEINTAFSDSRIYDNAVVGADPWNVTAILTNNLLSAGITLVGGHWEIRSGVSAGDPGTLIGSGDVLSGFGFSFVPGLDITPSGFSIGWATCQTPDIVLDANTAYWFSCTPIGTGSGRSFEANTLGANGFSGFGSHLHNTAFWDSDYVGVNFVDSEDTRGCAPPVSECREFSFGVVGTTQSEVPEPSTLLLLGAGLLGVAPQIRRRWFRQPSLRSRSA